MGKCWLWGTGHHCPLSAIDMPELHQYIQENDAAALADCDEEGVHQPLLIDSLDLSLWTSLFVSTTNDPTKTMAKIKSAQAKLGDLLQQDEQETTRSIGVCSMIEEALRLANNDALESTSTRSLAEPSQESCNLAATTDNAHPLLAKLKISSAERSALEDFTETLNSSQTEKDKQTLIYTKGPVVPVKPPRCVELLVADHQHRMWAIGNTNLLAPITIPMWKTWAGISENELEHCKKQALNNVGVLRAHVDLIPAFSLNMFEHLTFTEDTYLVKHLSHNDVY